MSDTPDTPRPSEQPKRPVINVDADPHNANWLRILAQRREQQQAGQEQPPSSDQSDQSDQKVP